MITIRTSDYMRRIDYIKAYRKISRVYIYAKPIQGGWAMFRTLSDCLAYRG